MNLYFHQAREALSFLRPFDRWEESSWQGKHFILSTAFFD